MKTQKAYKFRFYPTQEQVEQLAKEFGAARWVWNRALREKEYAYQQWNVNLTAQYDICRHITQYKKTEQYQWLNEVTATCLSQKLIDLDRAFDNFFKGRAKFPKSKKKEHGQSIRYQLDQRNIAKNYRPSELLRLPKLGELNIKWSRRPAGIPKMATVSKTASGKYFVCFMC
jgi:putative transposase